MLRDKKAKAQTVPVSPARAPVPKEAPPAAKPPVQEEEEEEVDFMAQAAAKMAAKWEK